MEKEKTLIKVIKQQAEIFLLDAREFYPFGSSIGKENQIIPIGVYIEAEDDRPESQPVIDLLDKGMKKNLGDGTYLIGALAYDVVMTKNHEKFDVMVIRIYESDKFVERYFKYDIYEDHVTFLEVEA